MSQTKFLVTVIGPTAIGKTSAAIGLAKHFCCEIISCDSRQFYREMSIGTAVPSDEELSEAKHHFIHNKSIHENYTVGDFEKEALSKLDGLFLTNNFAVLVGGSGLYVDAILKGFDNFPEADQSIRKKINDNYRSSGIDWLRQALKKVDPLYYQMVDTSNPQRMMRALEVSVSSGQPYSGFLKNNENQRTFIPIIIGLDADRETIYTRINERVDVMIANGLVEEAQKLYPFKDLNALHTVGYRELFSYFDEVITMDAAIGEIKKNSRRFAKRQMTWFRRMKNVCWFSFHTDISGIIDFIETEAVRLRS